MDAADLAIVQASFGATRGTPHYNPIADVNRDVIVGSADRVNLNTLGSRVMKDVRRSLAGLTIGLAVLAPPFLVAGASASSLFGTVTFVGTLTAGATNANVRVRISSGECDGQKVNAQWVHISSGALNASTAEINITNMRNAYSTLLAALLTGKGIQIDGIPSCSTTEPIPLELPNGTVGLF